MKFLHNKVLQAKLHKKFLKSFEVSPSSLSFSMIWPHASYKNLPTVRSERDRRGMIRYWIVLVVSRTWLGISLSLVKMHMTSAVKFKAFFLQNEKLNKSLININSENGNPIEWNLITLDTGIWSEIDIDDAINWWSEIPTNALLFVLCDGR